jgi:hypothetical protein
MTGKPASRFLALAILGIAVALAVELLARAGLAVLAGRGVRYQPLLADELSVENRRAIEDFLAGRPSPFELDGVLGWTLRPGFHSPQVTVDAAGRRRAPDRPPPAANAVRVAAFGDSFTFGGDVVDRDALLEALARLDQGIDVANYGVPAYGLDQAFLRYVEEGRAARAQVVAIGYLSENICRNVSVFRPYYSPRTVFPLAKPRYRQSAGGLELLPNPLPTPESYRNLLAHPAATLAELGRHDAFYRSRPHVARWDGLATMRLLKLAAAQVPNPSRDGCYGDEEALTVTTGLFDLFYETVLRDGAQPIILIFPARDEVERWRRDHRKQYAPLLEVLDGKGYRFVDAMDVFDTTGRSLSTDELIPTHLSPLANTLVAVYLRQRLQIFGLIPGV